MINEKKKPANFPITAKIVSSCKNCEHHHVELVSHALPGMASVTRLSTIHVIQAAGGDMMFPVLWTCFVRSEALSYVSTGGRLVVMMWMQAQSNTAEAFLVCALY
jgi:hypothetical protein